MCNENLVTQISISLVILVLLVASAWKFYLIFQPYSMFFPAPAVPVLQCTNSYQLSFISLPQARSMVNFRWGFGQWRGWHSSRLPLCFCFCTSSPILSFFYLLYSLFSRIPHSWTILWLPVPELFLFSYIFAKSSGSLLLNPYPSLTWLMNKFYSISYSLTTMKNQ
jgi:hypothetical protein